MCLVRPTQHSLECAARPAHPVAAQALNSRRYRKLPKVVMQHVLQLHHSTPHSSSETKPGSPEAGQEVAEDGHGKQDVQQVGGSGA